MAVKFTKPEINVREKLAELDKPSGIAGEAMLRAETPQEQFNLIGAGRRNLLINGDFKISQRGDYTSASSANTTYWLDRWYSDIGTVAATRQQTTGLDFEGSPAITKGAKITATASGNSYLGIRQKIEDPTQYVGRTFTYSAYVRSNSSQCRLSTYIQGTNQLTVSETHSGNGNWEKLSLTFTMTGVPSSGWYVSAFISSAGISLTPITTGDYIEITMAQMELGKVATPFEHRSYGEELALCQRYFERVRLADRHQGKLHGVTQAHFTYAYRVKKRATPSLSNGLCTLIYDGTSSYTDANVTFSSKDHDGINDESVTYRIITGSSMGTPIYRNLGGYGLGFDIDAEL